jgi:hypothetical protein
LGWDDRPASRWERGDVPVAIYKMQKWTVRVPGKVSGLNCKLSDYNPMGEKEL